MTDLKPQDHEKRFVSNDPFFMAIIALYGREPHDKVVTPTDRDEFTVTMRYSPEDSNEMPFFSDFIITNPNLPQFKTTLKDFKNEYLRFRNIILGIVAQAKKDNKIKGKTK